jgi:hypothetical protein
VNTVVVPPCPGELSAEDAGADVDVDVETEEEGEVEVEVVELLGPPLPQAVRSPAAVTTTAATRAARPKRATRRVGPVAD